MRAGDEAGATALLARAAGQGSAAAKAELRALTEQAQRSRSAGDVAAAAAPAGRRRPPSETSDGGGNADSSRDGVGDGVGNGVDGGGSAGEAADALGVAAGAAMPAAMPADERELRGGFVEDLSLPPSWRKLVNAALPGPLPDGWADRDVHLLARDVLVAFDRLAFAHTPEVRQGQG